MKKIYSYLLVMATLLIGGGKAMAQSVTVDGVAYTISGDHAYVSGNNSGVGDTVVVCDTVTVNDVKYPVTSIGAYAFQNNSTIVSVTLPDGIVSIGDYAFESCSNLTSIHLGKGLGSIGGFAFRYCRKLITIEFPEGLKSIANYAFSTCESFTDIVVPDGVTFPGGCVFEYCYNLKSITLPKGITNLPAHTFWSCYNLKSIIIPEGVTTIGQETFYNCSSLTTVTLPKSVTTIEDKAFYYCSSLTTINIPAEAVITNVGTMAFSNTQITFPEENGIRYMGSVAYELTDRTLTEYVIKEGTTAIYSGLFASCTNMTSITIPSSVVSIGENAFSYCTGLPIENGIRYADCYAVEVTDKTLTEYQLKDSVRFLSKALFQNCSAMTAVTIPAGVTEIGDNTFYGCSALTSLTLPETVTSIGAHAFTNCSSLTAVNVPYGVSVIGEQTFFGCSALTSLTLPQTVTSIGNQAFYGCSLLASINIPSGVTVIGDYTFYNCSALTSIALPDSLTSIGNYAFNRCSGLTALTLPKNLTTIGTEAFRYCYNLQRVINYSDLLLSAGSSNYGYVASNAQVVINVDTIIDEFYFDKDSNGKYYLTYYEGTDSILTLPSDCQGENYGIGDRVFNGHSEIVSIQIPDGVTSIGASAFYNCSSLTSVNIPAGVTEIGDKTFRGCSSLTSLTLPETVTSIGASAFYNCSLITSVNIPSGVTKIGDYTFYNCSALTSLTIPASVTSIGNYAFQGCTELKELTLDDGGNTLSLGYNGSYVGLFTPCKLEKLYLGRNLSYSTNYSPFYNNDRLKDVVIGDRVTSIAAHAFSNCDSITTITLPQSVTTICDGAFLSCSSLASISLPDSLTSIGVNAFRNCSKLATLTLPKSLTSIGNYAFRDCNNLQRVINYSDLLLSAGSSNYGYVAYNAQVVINVDTIIDGYWFDTDINGRHHLTYYEGTDSVLVLPSDYQGGNYCIDGTVFSGHTEVVSIQIPESVDSIGTSAFFGCSSLTAISLPETVASIGASAFYNCSSLTSVNIPAGVTEIGDNTFYGCSSLTSLTLPETVTSIGASAFYNCSLITSVNIPSGVTKIGDYTFYNCSALTSLTIPASVTSISNHAFENCTGLKELIFADGGKTLSLGTNGHYDNGALFRPCKLEKLYLGRNLSYNTDWYYGRSPFYNITTLKEVVVGDSVTAIGDYAFNYCSSLVSIELPDSLTSIGYDAFSGCNILTHVHCGFDTPAVLSGKGLREQAVIYVPAGTYVPYKETFPNNIIVDGSVKEVTVHVAIPGTLGEEVLNQVPYIRNVNSLKVSGTLNSDDLGTINGSMINLLHLNLSKANMTSVNGVGHANLLSIVFPDSCKSISGYSERKNLTSVILPDAVETLANNCFENCDQLAEVTMSANLKTVGDGAFKYCRKLKEITFKDGLTTIGSEAFYDCNNLTSVSFGAGDKTIEGLAFSSCDNLESVSFGDGVATITGGRFSNKCFGGCNNLRTLVIGDGISVSASGSDAGAFSSCYSISEIHVPNLEAWLNSTFNNNYLQNIPNYASSNANLYIDGELVTDIVIPSSVTSIRQYAFHNMSGITSVTIPEGVTSIANNAFSNCSALNSVTIAEGVRTISSEAFYNCDRLDSIVVPDGVNTIQANAFAACNSLRSITLPSTLSNCAAGAFSGSGLTEVTCPAFFPPVTGGDLIGANNCTLYVPEWTLNRYKLANNWNLFASIEPLEGIYPSTISVYTEEALAIPEDLPEEYTPNMEIVRYDGSNVGRFTVRGEKALPLTTFKMQQTRSTSSMTSLVNYGTLTADSVATELSISANAWHYLSFPYDVKIADIATLGDWVIRRYDGAARARADFANTWQNVPYDSILHAGEGYIWYSTNGNFTVPAIENDNRNLIFANDTRYTQLKEHASATVANYGWNLIGNPYPCFYDIRFLEYEAPVTVRNGNSYAAYSPLDDSYILSPLEAFFVQCSADNNVVGFGVEGRQTDNTVREITAAPQRSRAANADRKVFNLYLENGSYADHTRFVINENASTGYEIARDAAKFMSDDPTVQQLFTIEGSERMAINERPLANGEVMLGVYFGKAGSYTIALDTRATEMEVVLVDKYTGEETDLLTNAYTFTTEAGTFTDRFAINVKRTDDITAIEEAAAGKLEVVAVAGGISVTNATAPIHVYNAAGALIAVEHGNTVTVEVAPGIYVVKVGDEAHKVSVIK